MSGAESSAQTHIYDDHRPRCHLAPPAGWMNDPNGPVFYKGRYHMFYQHLPNACEWDFGIIWGHAVSSNLTTWEHLPPALVPTPGWVDADGCFSGCCIIDSSTGRPVILYTGVRLRSNTNAGPLPPPEQDLGMVWIESQCVAVPVDPGDDLLIEWKKVEAPFLPLPPLDLELTGWRDPFIFTTHGTSKLLNGSERQEQGMNNNNKIEDGGGGGGGGKEASSSSSSFSFSSPSTAASPSIEYRILMGSGIKGKGGTALVYRSTDLMSGWELEGTLCEGDAEDSGVVWECPLLVPLTAVPLQQRSRHPNAPPPWLHASDQKHYATGQSMLQSMQQQAGGAVVVDNNHNARDSKMNAAAATFQQRGISSPPSSSSSLSREQSSHLAPRSLYPTTTSGGAPSTAIAAAAAVVVVSSGAGKIVVPKSWPTTSSLQLDQQQDEHEQLQREKNKQNNNRAAAAVAESKKEEDQQPPFQFSSGEASPGARGLDRQGSVEMWPSSSGVRSPIQETDIDDGIDGGGAATTATAATAPSSLPTSDPLISVQELAERLERAATLESWNLGDFVSSSTNGGGNGNGVRLPSIAHSPFITTTIPTGTTTSTTTTTAASGLPRSTSEGDEDKFAIALSKVPALHVKKSALDLNINTTTTTTTTTTSVSDTAQGYNLPPAFTTTQDGGAVTNLFPLAIPSPPSTTSPAAANGLLTSPHPDTITTLPSPRHQWHFFTVSPDAPTNPVLYWTGFVNEPTTTDTTTTTTTTTKVPQFMIETAKGPFRLDLGDILYAPNVCQDDTGRWLLWGWLQERRKVGTYSYAGCLSIPRVLHVTDEGRLVQAPAPEVVDLRQGQEFHAEGVTLYPEAIVPIQWVSGERLDIECTLERGSALAAGLLFRSYEAETDGSTAIVYDWDKNQLEAIFNVPPNWQPCAVPPPPSTATAAAAAAAAGITGLHRLLSAGGDGSDIFDADDGGVFDAAAYLCTPRYSLSRTPSVSVFSPATSSPRERERESMGGGGGGGFDTPPLSSSPMSGRGGGGGAGNTTTFSVGSLSSSAADLAATIGFGSFSTGVGGGGGGGVSIVKPLPRQGSSLSQCLQRSGSHLNMAAASFGGAASGAGIGGGALGGGGGAVGGGGGLSRTGSYLGSSLPRLNSFSVRGGGGGGGGGGFMLPGSPRSTTLGGYDAAEAAELDAELSTLLEDLAAPMRTAAAAAEESAAPPVEPRRVGGPLLMRPSDKLHLRIFVDHSCIEVFTGTGEVLSTRIYRGRAPEVAGDVDAGIEFVAFGGAAVLEKVSAYEVASSGGGGGKEEEEAAAAEEEDCGAAVHQQHHHPLMYKTGGSAASIDNNSSAGTTPSGGTKALNQFGAQSAAERADQFFDEMLSDIGGGATTIAV